MGYVSAFCYGVLVPCALAYLYARQHLALLPGKMMMAPSVKDGNDGALEIRLAELSSCSWATSKHVCGKISRRCGKSWC